MVLGNPDIETAEYDLNIFYEDLGHDEDGVNQWADVYTIQPSIYINDVYNRSSRIYLDAFKLTLEETRALEPDFPEDEWGSDFFIAMEAFYELAKVVPTRVHELLSNLPDLEKARLNPDAEINLIN